MAKYRPKIPEDIKKELLNETDGKCANPGCPNDRTHFHHIKEWAVYKVHDGNHMIAICPLCHDEVHHGKLKIGDNILYRWKTLIRARKKSITRAQLYIENSQDSILFVGPFAFRTRSGSLTAFKLLGRDGINFSIINDDFHFINLSLTINDLPIINIVNNAMQISPPDKVTLLKAQGKVVLQTNKKSGVIPDWIIDLIRKDDPSFPRHEQLGILDLEVLAPGTVKISEAIMVNGSEAIVVTPKVVYILQEGANLPLPISSEGVFDYPSSEASSFFEIVKGKSS